MQLTICTVEDSSLSTHEVDSSTGAELEGESFKQLR